MSSLNQQSSNKKYDMCTFENTHTHTHTHTRARTHARTHARAHTHRGCVSRALPLKSGFFATF